MNQVDVGPKLGDLSAMPRVPDHLKGTRAALFFLLHSGQVMTEKKMKKNEYLRETAPSFSPQSNLAVTLTQALGGVTETDSFRFV